jgi:hypothetical protein
MVNGENNQLFPIALADDDPFRMKKSSVSMNTLGPRYPPMYPLVN